MAEREGSEGEMDHVLERLNELSSEEETTHGINWSEVHYDSTFSGERTSEGFNLKSEYSNFFQESEDTSGGVVMAEAKYDNQGRLSQIQYKIGDNAEVVVEVTDEIRRSWTDINYQKVLNEVGRNFPAGGIVGSGLVHPDMIMNIYISRLLQKEGPNRYSPVSYFGMVPRLEGPGSSNSRKPWGFLKFSSTIDIEASTWINSPDKVEQFLKPDSKLVERLSLPPKL